MKKRYIINKKTVMKSNILDWEAAEWNKAELADINGFHEKSSAHHPATRVKIQYDDENIYVLFRVNDRYVRSTHAEYNSKVHEDSCVEWFIKPANAEGYYNFEMNAGGTLHVNYIIDPERDQNGKRKNLKHIPENHAKMIDIYTSLPRVIDPEITEEVSWSLALIVPFEFFNLYTPIEKINSSIWQGNLYKCGDKTSQPHWGYWNPIQALNFHQPECFGEFKFSKK